MIDPTTQHPHAGGTMVNKGAVRVGRWAAYRDTAAAQYRESLAEARALRLVGASRRDVAQTMLHVSYARNQMLTSVAGLSLSSTLANLCNCSGHCVCNPPF